MTKKEKSILDTLALSPLLFGEASTYQDFSRTAFQEARKDIKRFPLEKNETKRDRYEKHLLGMLEMYTSKYNGISNTRTRLIAFKEIKKWADTHERKDLDNFLTQSIGDLEKDLRDLEGKEELVL